jgi:hypothetical protein
MTNRFARRWRVRWFLTKCGLAGLDAVGLSKGSAHVAYRTKAQIQFKLLTLEIRKRALRRPVSGVWEPGVNVPESNRT